MILKIIAIVLVVTIHLNMGMCKQIRKRQLYREQVQPHSGGKIPESAFETDRLILNRLQKEGIAIPHGIILEQRNPKVFPYSNNDLRPVFKVLSTSDNLSIDNKEILQSRPAISETTYPIPRTTEDKLLNTPIQTIPVHSTIYKPIYRIFSLPDLSLANASKQKNFGTPALSSSQLIHTPASTMGNGFMSHSILQYYHDDFVTSHILKDLSAFIDNVGYDIPFGRPLR